MNKYSKEIVLDIKDSETSVVFLIDLYIGENFFYYPSIRDRAFVKSVLIKGTKYIFSLEIEEGRGYFNSIENFV